MAVKKRKGTMKVKTDAWENIITQLGRSRDKRTGARVIHPAFIVNEDTFADLYHADDMAARIASLPPHEMTREWIDIRSDDSASTSGVRIETTAERVDVAKLALQKLDDLDAQKKVFQALVWARVFGSGLLFLGADDGWGGDLGSATQAVREPLRLDQVRSFDFMHVVHRFELDILEVDSNPFSPTYNEPTLYRWRTTPIAGANTVQQFEVHASRFIRFDGVHTTPRRMQGNSGWSDSIFIRLEDIVRDYASAWGSLSHLFQDISQAVYKIDGLAAALASDGDSLIINRLQTLDLCRAVHRAIPLDAESEDFERKATPLAGVPELTDRLTSRLAAAAQMPVALLMGESPAGLQATGASDIRFFYDQIAAKQETMLRPALGKILQTIFMAADGPTRGREPDNWSLEFKPLWQMTDGEQAELRNKQASTDVLYINSGVLSSDEVAQSRFGGDRYSTETILDSEARAEQLAADDALDDEVIDDGEVETAPPAAEPTDGGTSETE